MYIKCLKILKLLHSNDISKTYSVNYLLNKTEIKEQELKEILKYLESKKLVHIHWVGTTKEPNKLFEEISLTIKGKHYLTNVILIPVIKQIGVPIVVSVITTLITIFLTNSL